MTFNYSFTWTILWTLLAICVPNIVMVHLSKSPLFFPPFFLSLIPLILSLPNCKLISSLPREIQLGDLKIAESYSKSEVLAKDQPTLLLRSIDSNAKMLKTF